MVEADVVPEGLMSSNLSLPTALCVSHVPKPHPWPAYVITISLALVNPFAGPLIHICASPNLLPHTQRKLTTVGETVLVGVLFDHVVILGADQLLWSPLR
jgi:hypothetical protein